MFATEEVEGHSTYHRPYCSIPALPWAVEAKVLDHEAFANVGEPRVDVERGLVFSRSHMVDSKRLLNPQSSVPQFAVRLCANRHAVGAHLPRVPNLLDGSVAKRAIVVDRHHEDLGVPEDRSRGHIPEGSVGGVPHVVLGREAAAEAGEGAGEQVLGARVKARCRGRCHQLAARSAG